MTKPKASPVSLLGLFVWFLAALFFLYEFFLRTFIGSVAHQVMPDLHLNVETFALMSTGYFVAYGVMQIPVGVLVDKWGVKVNLVGAILICVLGVLLFSWSQGFFQAFGSRFLMGAGSSFAFVSLLVIAMTWFPARFFAFFAGVSQFIGTMGPMLAGGPLIAIMAHEHLDWRYAMFVTAMIGLGLAILVALFVKNKPKQGRQALIMLSLDQPLRLRLKQLLTNKQAWWVALYSATIYISISLLGATWGTEYLQVRGLSQAVAASMISLAWLGYAIGCPVLGAFSDIAKRRKPLLIVCALLGAVATFCITYIGFEQHVWVYGVLFFSLGLAASGQNIGFAAIAEHVDENMRATAMGLNNGAITLFAATVPPLVSYFIMSSQGARAQLLPTDFYYGFMVMPLMFVLGAVLACFFIRETYCRPQKQAVPLAP